MTDPCPCAHCYHISAIRASLLIVISTYYFICKLEKVQIKLVNIDFNKEKNCVYVCRYLLNKHWYTCWIGKRQRALTSSRMLMLYSISMEIGETHGSWRCLYASSWKPHGLHKYTIPPLVILLWIITRASPSFPLDKICDTSLTKYLTLIVYISSNFNLLCFVFSFYFHLLFGSM